MVKWTDYFKYRAQMRNYNLDQLAQIVCYSTERYFDTATNRLVVVGKHKGNLVLIPYEIEEYFTPVTVHPITRQQINFRLKTGRFTIYE